MYEKLFQLSNKIVADSVRVGKLLRRQAPRMTHIRRRQRRQVFVFLLHHTYITHVTKALLVCNAIIIVIIIITKAVVE